MAEMDGATLLAILGLTAITVITRSFFFISQRPWRMPAWAQRALQYAPIAALAAVIAPDIFTSSAAHPNLPWRDARLWGAVGTALFYIALRGRDFTLPGAIVFGIAVYLPLRLVWGW
ncbi:MAG: AzlD domain-containing protein [Burkholderiaceae bacterium]|jgi:branched-subunit amino acid transport protein|nr:AzlD domain-containing protein [Burkholderiaceae bacterium]